MKPFRPMLPPRPGFIEYDDNGVRRYRKIETDEEERLAALEEKMIELEPLKAQLTETQKTTTKE